MNKFMAFNKFIKKPFADEYDEEDTIKLKDILLRENDGDDEDESNNDLLSSLECQNEETVRESMFEKVKKKRQ